MRIRHSIRHYARVAVAVFAGLLSQVACSDKDRADLGVLFFFREMVVLPNGSFLTDKYWAVSVIGFGTREITYADLPSEAKVTTIVHNVQYPASLRAGPTEASLVIDSNTARVALFAGGRGPGNALASDRAAVYSDSGTMVTGLHMTAARLEHAMAPISGDRVLITGGLGPEIPTVFLNSAEIFTFASRSFAATGNMNQRRSYHSATPLADGRVLITGGSVPTAGTGPAGNPSLTTEIFDPSTGAFTVGPSMLTARSGHSAVRLDDGRVLVLGGTASRNAHVYSPTTNTFTAVGQLVAARVSGQQAVKLENGKVLVVGGDATGNVQPTAAAELFDPATNTFTAIVNMSTPRMHHFAVLLDDGRVYIGGGRTSGGSVLNTAEVFSPATNAFTAAPTLPTETYGGPAALVWGKRPQ